MSTRDDGKGSENKSPDRKKKSHRRSWEEGYQDLKSFYETNGHCRCGGRGLLGSWARQQRHKKRDNKLSAEQIELLNGIDFDWETQEDKNELRWQHMFGLLKEYKAEHGNTRVPQKEIFGGETLGNWVTSQQSSYRDEHIKDHRKILLDGIGFEWIRDERLLWKGTDRPLGIMDVLWNEKFDALCQYKEREGDTLVVPGHMDTLEDGNEYDLGAFVCRQRTLHREGALRKDRQEKLESIGFTFTIDIYDAEASKNQKAWEEMYNKLKSYKDTYGDCDVPAVWDEDQHLGHWCRIQRAFYSRGELAEIRFRRLDDLGFTWSPLGERWKSMVECLRNYRAEHGDCKVPDGYLTSDGAKLGQWVRVVRRRRNEIDEARRQELDSMGFIWENTLHLHWDIMYDALCRYKDTHGHCRVPQSYKGDKDDLPSSLGSWVSVQRQFLGKRIEETKEEVYLERRNKLLAVGFEFSLAHIPNENWDTMFQSLARYRDKFGDCRVPGQYVENAGEKLPKSLGTWVQIQRWKVREKAQQGIPLWIERKNRLDDIGFSWEPVTEDNWARMFDELKKYHAKYGNCLVPKQYAIDWDKAPTSLRSWVGVQKSVVLERANQGHPIYIERKKLLDSLNFEYDNVFKLRWEEMFERLKEYHAKHGHCSVPTTHDEENDGCDLSGWTRRQRQVLDKAKSGDPEYVERKRLLESINFEFERVDDKKFETMLELLKEFAKEHGHCDVPFSYDQGDSNRPLGKWCYEQRRTIMEGLKSSKCNNDYRERKRLLDEIGFLWVVDTDKDKKWNKNFELLRSFKEKHGHCFVPPEKEPSDSSLYAWVNLQHRKIPDKAKTGDPVYTRRKELLDSIGFEWKRIYDDAWEKMYMAVIEYKEKHGHCRVPYRGKGAVEGPTGGLGIWVYRQRTKVPPKAAEGDPTYVERKQRLDDIGFDFTDDGSLRWETMFGGLKRFFDEYGHCRVKRDYVNDKDPMPANLGSWMSIQRKLIPEKVAKGDPMAIERKERLDALGFVWKTRASPKAYERNGKLIGGKKDAPPGSELPAEKKQAITRRKRTREESSDIEFKPDGSTGRELNASIPTRKRKLISSTRQNGQSTSRKTRSMVRRQAETESVRTSEKPWPSNQNNEKSKLCQSSNTVHEEEDETSTMNEAFAFSPYDGSHEPIMWKKPFAHYKARKRNTVKEKLPPPKQTKENILELLKNNWRKLEEQEKNYFRNLSQWDKARYEREVEIYGQIKKNQDSGSQCENDNGTSEV